MHAFRLHAQLDNAALESSVWDDEPERWGVTLYNLNYLRNTEYFTPIDPGRTWLGYQIQPQLYGQLTKDIRLQAGVFLQSDFGANPSINRILPTFTLRIHEPKSGIDFIFGTLDGALSHRLIEPLFNIDAGISQRIENGLQIKKSSTHFFGDCWINWQRFIEPLSPYQEQFTAGIHLRPQIGTKDKGWTVAFPLQATGFHRGGQIDTDSNNLVMIWNTAAGVDMQWYRANQIEFGWSSYYALYAEQSSSGFFPFSNGSGWMINSYFKKGASTCMLSYWHANEFASPVGTPIYQSVSSFTPGYTESNRELLFLRLLYTKSITNHLTCTGRLEPFYDMRSSKAFLAFSCYVSYSLQQAFGTFKP